MAPVCFIADENVGKLGRLLRMLGFDTALFSGDDREMVSQALREGRIILTRDTRVAQVRPAVRGELQVITLATDNPEEQLRQVLSQLGLKDSLCPFTRCLECNRELRACAREEAIGRVPPYVYATQTQYRECPA